MLGFATSILEIIIATDYFFNIGGLKNGKSQKE
jgi:hypothetical protein